MFFRCKPGFFNLESSNPRGCTPCFCFGHSSVCTNAVGYSVYSITSTFQIGNLDVPFLSPRIMKRDLMVFFKKSVNFEDFLMVATFCFFNVCDIFGWLFGFFI